MFCRPRGVTEKSEELSWMLSYTDALPVLTLAQVDGKRWYSDGRCNFVLYIRERGSGGERLVGMVARFSSGG